MGSLPVKATVNAIAIDPRDPKIVFVAGTSGVFRSTDAGLSWEARGRGLGRANIVALTLSPNQPDTLFASTAEGLLFRSDDATQSWNLVSTTSSR